MRRREAEQLAPPPSSPFQHLPAVCESVGERGMKKKGHTSNFAMHHFLIVLRQFLLPTSWPVPTCHYSDVVPNLSNDLVKDLFDTDIGRWSAKPVCLQDGSHVSCNALRLLLGGKEIVTYPVIPHKM